MNEIKACSPALDKGFVVIHRSMLLWEWYPSSPTKDLFFHLILTVNWTDGKWMGNTVKRGQRICSLPKLSGETGLSIQQLRTAIKRLRATGEITCEKVRVDNTPSTLFTVNNYDAYQLPTAGSTDEPTAAQQQNNSSPTAVQQQLNNNNKYNNITNWEEKPATAPEKVLFGDNVYLTDAQHKLLLKDFGDDDTHELISLLDRYKAETGKEYSSDYHAIRKWVVEKLAQEKQKQTEKSFHLPDTFSLEDFTEKPDPDF